MKLLLLSSSRAKQSAYLAPALGAIADTLIDIKEVLFIPYAGVSIEYDAYVAQVQTALAPQGITIQGIHQYPDAKLAVQQANAIMIGGGNTFALLTRLYEADLVEVIQQQVLKGTPYIGWSAGANIAGLSIRTTNDMPIVEPPTFQALALLPLQLNPHYTDFVPEGFHGETRDMRLAEFMRVAPTTPVIGIPEGTYLRYQADKLEYIGDEPGYLFKGGNKTAIAPHSELNEWLRG